MDKHPKNPWPALPGLLLGAICCPLVLWALVSRNLGSERVIALLLAGLTTAVVLLAGALLQYRRREQRRRTRERDWQASVEDAGVGIYQVALDGTILQANRRLAEIFGFDSPEDFLRENERITDLYLRPQDRRPIVQALEDKGIVEGAEARFRRRDGQVIWIRINARRITDENGDARLEGVMVDITAHKAAGAFLRQREQLLRATLNSTADGILVTDENGRVLVTSRRFAEMWQLPPEALEGDPSDDRLIAAICGQLEDPEDLRATGRAGDRPGEETRRTLLLRDGRVLEHVSTPLLSDGAPAGRVWNFRDVTQRMQNEKALEEREHRMRMLVVHTPAAVAMCDREMRYLAYSRRWALDYGLGDEDLVGRCHYDVFETIPEKWKQEHQRCFVGEVIENEEEAFTRADGRVDWVRRKVHPWRNDRGRVGGLIMFTEVITARKQVEEQLARYRQRLENLVEERTAELRAAQAELVRQERLAALGKLTATVSHELRNPLGTINSSLYTIGQRTGDRGLGVKPALERALRNIQRCDGIIEELLDFTRNRQIAPESTELAPWLDTLLDGLPIPADIELKRNLAADARLPVDRERLRRCVFNIIENAWQAIEKKADPSAPRRIQVDTRRTGRRYEIRIRDTGAGMDDEQCRRFFEPLFSTRNFGVGLGTTNALQMMEMHHGGIDVQSRPGEGTLVTLWLPCDGREV